MSVQFGAIEADFFDCSSQCVFFCNVNFSFMIM